MSLKRKQKPKKKKKINVKKKDSGVSYVCCNCGIEETKFNYQNVILENSEAWSWNFHGCTNINVFTI